MLRYMTAGESHGKGLMTIIDGVPAGLKLEKSFIDKELARRMVGYGRGGRMKIEKDKADILSGLRKGITIGSPVGLVIKNKDFKIDKLPDVISPRPGHADLAGIQKYAFKDARNVLERASARETAARVAAGSVGKAILKELGIKLTSHVTSLGKIHSEISGASFNRIKEKAEKSDLRCADPVAAKLMRREIDAAKKNGDTLGGSFEVIVTGLVPGLGSYTQWDKRLDGNLARAVMAVQAVKGVSIGCGIAGASATGSDVHDPIVYDKKSKSYKRLRNNAGGIEGGMTNGEDIIIVGFMKPIATLMNPLESVNIKSKGKSYAATERSDVTAVASCGVVAEAVVAVELASSLIDKFGGDSILEMKRNLAAYKKYLKTV
jgi:chorismate synthase